MWAALPHEPKASEGMPVKKMHYSKKITGKNVGAKWRKNGGEK